VVAFFHALGVWWFWDAGHAGAGGCYPSLPHRAPAAAATPAALFLCRAHTVRLHLRLRILATLLPRLHTCSTALDLDKPVSGRAFFVLLPACRARALFLPVPLCSLLEERSGDREHVSSHCRLPTTFAYHLPYKTLQNVLAAAFSCMVCGIHLPLRWRCALAYARLPRLPIHISSAYGDRAFPCAAFRRPSVRSRCWGLRLAAVYALYTACWHHALQQCLSLMLRAWRGGSAAGVALATVCIVLPICLPRRFLFFG